MRSCRVCGHRDHGSGIDYDAGGNKYVDPCECEEGGCPCEGDPGWFGGSYVTLALYVDFETWLLRFQSVLGTEDKAWEWMAKAAEDYCAVYYADTAHSIMTINDARERRMRQAVAGAVPQ